MTLTTHASIIRELFDDYERMIDGDPELARSLYAETFTASGPKGMLSGSNDEEFRTMVGAGLDQYRALGMTAMRIRGIDEHWLGDRHCVATVHWHSEWDQSDPIDFEDTYLVRLDEGDDAPRIFGWISHEDENDVMRSNGIMTDNDEQQSLR